MVDIMPEEFSVPSGEMIWMIVVVLVILAVGVIFFAMNPQFQQAANDLLCKSYYDILYFFGGPRPPIEVCGPPVKAGATTTTISADQPLLPLGTNP